LLEEQNKTNKQQQQNKQTKNKKKTEEWWKSIFSVFCKVNQRLKEKKIQDENCFYLRREI